MPKNKLITTLQWIGILPLAAAGYFIGYGISQLLNILGEWTNIINPTGWVSLYIWPVFCYYVAGWAFVAWGKIIAPSYEKEVALALLILLCFVSGFWCFAVLTLSKYLSILYTVAQMVGGIVAYKSKE